MKVRALELGIASLFPFRVEGRSGAGVVDTELKAELWGVGWAENINSLILGCREAACGLGCNFAALFETDDEDEAATDV